MDHWTGNGAQQVLYSSWDKHNATTPTSCNSIMLHKAYVEKKKQKNKCMF